VLLLNLGPNTAYFADGIVAPTPSVGNGRYGLQSGEILALPSVNIKNLSFCCAAVETASIQAMGMPNGALDGVAPAPAAAGGFYVEWNGPVAASGPSPKTSLVACSVPVNGATSAAATCPSGKVRYAGTFQTYLQFDGGAWQLANNLILAWGGCFAILNVTEVSTPVDCTGKSNLTGIKCIVTEVGQNVTLSGLIHVVGTAEVKTSV